MIPATMRGLAEAELAKMYRQWARGRAIVQTNCMKEARALKRRLLLGSLDTRSERYLAQIRINSNVRRARQAVRDWRRYRRQMHDALKEGL